MKKLLQTKIISLAFVSVLSSVNAMEGLQMGAQVGSTFAEFKHKRSYTNATVLTALTALGVSKSTSDNVSSQGAFGGLHLGYGMFVDDFYVGVDFAGNYTNLTGQNRAASRWNFAKYTHNFSGTGSLDLGYKTSASTLVYVKAGASYGSFKFTSWAPATTVTLFPTSKVSKTYRKFGFLGGAGFRHALDKTWDVGMEYTLTKYSDKKIPQTGFATNAISSTIHQVGVRVTYAYDVFGS